MVELLRMHAERDSKISRVCFSYLMPRMRSGKDTKPPEIHFCLQSNWHSVLTSLRLTTTGLVESSSNRVGQLPHYWIFGMNNWVDASHVWWFDWAAIPNLLDDRGKISKFLTAEPQFRVEYYRMVEKKSPTVNNWSSGGISQLKGVPIENSGV